MADALLHHGALVWGVSVLAWALRPQFSPIRWGDSNLLVTPLLRVIPRREKLRKGQPPRHLPLPSRPHDPADMPTGQTATSRPGARSSRLGHLGPTATGGWGTPGPPPTRGCRRRATAQRRRRGVEGTAESGPALLRTHHALRCSAPAPAASSGPSRVPSRAAWCATGRGALGLSSPLAPSLAPGRQRAPPHWPDQDPAP